MFLKNTVAIGAVFGYLSIDFEELANVIRDQFGGFALMTEAVGMAAEMEIPLVVYEALIDFFALTASFIIIGFFTIPVMKMIS